MVFNEFNPLGHLVRKNLHFDWNWPDDYMQHIDYRYNVRGWLTSINNAELIDDFGVKNEDDNDVFGEELFYDNITFNNGSFEAIPQYNGNISLIKWRSKTFAAVPYLYRPIHTYAYRYDDLNRLTAAYYAHNSDALPNDFTTDINLYKEVESYDLPGNLKTMERSTRGGITDILNYTYYNNAHQLAQVTDNAVSSYMQYDFKDNANVWDEYRYDENGNQTDD